MIWTLRYIYKLYINITIFYYNKKFCFNKKFYNKTICLYIFKISQLFYNNSPYFFIREPDSFNY